MSQLANELANNQQITHHKNDHLFGQKSNLSILAQFVRGFFEPHVVSIQHKRPIQPVNVSTLRYRLIKKLAQTPFDTSHKLLFNEKIVYVVYHSDIGQKPYAQINQIASWGDHLREDQQLPIVDPMETILPDKVFDHSLVVIDG